MNTNIQSNNLNFSTSKNTTNSSNTINTGTSSFTNNNINNSIYSNVNPEVETMDLSDSVVKTEKNSQSILASVGNWLLDISKSSIATKAVVAKSVYNGVANIGEGLADGLVWCGGKIVEGASFLGGKVAGWFSDEAEQSVMEWRDQAKTDIKEFIATDLVGEANEHFYKETSLGQWINDNSYLKYDSKGAQFITKGTEVVGKIAAATAATVVTGGTATPLALGFLFGTGEQAEKVYQNNTDTTGAQELGIFVSGIGEAANWYAQGQLGKGALNLVDIIKKNGLSATATTILTGAKSFLQNISKNGLKNTLKNTIKGTVSNSSLTSVMAADNLADSVGIVGDNLSDWLVGNEQFNLTNALKASGELLSAWLLNMGMDGLANYLIGKKGLSNVTEEVSELLDTNESITELVDSAPNSGNFFNGFNNANASSFGINQNATKELFTVRKKSNAWLRSEDSLRAFLKKEYPDFDDVKFEKTFNNYLTNDQISITRQEVIKKYIQSYEPNYNKAMQIYKSSIEPQNAKQIKHLVNKLEKLGIDHKDAYYILKTMNTPGICSYAAVANEIVAHYIDAPLAFERDFGFPLFIKDDLGNRVLNSSELLTDMFIYANTGPEDSLFSIDGAKIKLAKKDFSTQIRLSGFYDYKDDLIRSYLKTKSPSLEYRSIACSFENGKVIQRMGNGNWTGYESDVENWIKKGLARNDSMSLGIYRTQNKLYTFYNPDGSVHLTTNGWNEGDGHAIFVTGIDDEYIHVSSWGKDLKLKISEFKNNKYVVRANRIQNIDKTTSIILRKNNNWLFSESTLSTFLTKKFSTLDQTSINNIINSLKTKNVISSSQKDLIKEYLLYVGCPKESIDIVLQNSLSTAKVSNYIPNEYLSNIFLSIPKEKRGNYINAKRIITSMFEDNPAKFKEIFGYDITDSKALVSDLFAYVNSENTGGLLFRKQGEITSLVSKDLSHFTDINPQKDNIQRIIEDFVKSKNPNTSIYIDYAQYRPKTNGIENVVTNFRGNYSTFNGRPFQQVIAEQLQQGKKVSINISQNQNINLIDNLGNIQSSSKLDYLNTNFNITRIDANYIYAYDKDPTQMYKISHKELTGKSFELFSSIALSK